MLKCHSLDVHIVVFRDVALLFIYLDYYHYYFVDSICALQGKARAICATVLKAYASQTCTCT